MAGDAAGLPKSFLRVGSHTRALHGRGFPLWFMTATFSHVAVKHLVLALSVYDSDFPTGGRDTPPPRVASSHFMEKGLMGWDGLRYPQTHLQVWVS